MAKLPDGWSVEPQPLPEGWSVQSQPLPQGYSVVEEVAQTPAPQPAQPKPVLPAREGWPVDYATRQRGLIGALENRARMAFPAGMDDSWENPAPGELQPRGVTPLQGARQLTPEESARLASQAGLRRRSPEEIAQREAQEMAGAQELFDVMVRAGQLEDPNTPEYQAQATRDLFGNNPILRNINIGFQSAAMDTGSTLSRGFQSDPVWGRIIRAAGWGVDPDAINRGVNQTQMRAALTDEEDGFGSSTGALIRGGTQSITKNLTGTGVALMSGGSIPAILIADAAASRMNQAITEGKDAGLEGDALTGYVGRAGATEAGVAAAFQLVGLGGAEAIWGKALSGGIRGLILNTGRAVIQELPEELVISVLDSVNQKVSGVDPEALTAGNLKRTLANTASQTVAVTAFLGGTAGLMQMTPAQRSLTRSETARLLAEQHNIDRRDALQAFDYAQSVVGNIQAGSIEEQAATFVSVMNGAAMEAATGVKYVIPKGQGEGFGAPQMEGVQPEGRLYQENITPEGYVEVEPQGKRPWEMTREEHAAQWPNRGTRSDIRTPQMERGRAVPLTDPEAQEQLQAREINAMEDSKDGDGNILVYRVVPEGVDELAPGDFVVLDPADAETYKRPGYKIISQRVNPHDVVWVFDAKGPWPLRYAPALGGERPLSIRQHHEFTIRQAVEAGYPVPAHVLQEYAGKPWADAALAKLGAPVTVREAAPMPEGEAIPQGQGRQPSAILSGMNTGSNTPMIAELADAVSRGRLSRRQVQKQYGRETADAVKDELNRRQSIKAPSTDAAAVARRIQAVIAENPDDPTLSATTPNGVPYLEQEGVEWIELTRQQRQQQIESDLDAAEQDRVASLTPRQRVMEGLGSVRDTAIVMAEDIADQAREAGWSVSTTASQSSEAQYITASTDDRTVKIRVAAHDGGGVGRLVGGFDAADITVRIDDPEAAKAAMAEVRATLSTAKPTPPPARMKVAQNRANTTGEPVYLSQTPQGNWSVTKRQPKGRESVRVEPEQQGEESVDAVLAARLRGNAMPLPDPKGADTGWLQTKLNNDIVLVHPTRDAIVRFAVENKKSGTEVRRRYAESQAYAMDNPVRGEPSAPAGDIVIQSLQQPPTPSAQPTVSQSETPAPTVSTSETVASPGRSARSPANQRLQTTLEDTDGGKAISAAEILSSVRRMFGVTVRGRATHQMRDARGFYNLRTDGIRLKDVRDIATAMHEVGHYIDQKLGGRQGVPSAVRSELVGMGKELYGNRKPAISYTSEGWAEFLRYYTTTDEASVRAPETYKWFAGNFLPQNPDVGKAIRDTKQLVDRYRKQGAEKRMDAFINKRDDKGTIRERFSRATLWVDTMFRDELAPLRRGLQRSGIKPGTIRPDLDPVELAVAYADKAPAKAREFVMEFTTDLAGNYTGKSLSDVLAPVSDDIDAFTRYMVAARALDLHGRGKNPGVTQADARYLYDRYDSPEWRQVAQEVTDWNDRLMQFLVEAGGLSAEAAQTIRALNPVYVPFMRAFGAQEKRQMGGTGKGLTKSGKPIKQLKGSSREIIDPLESMILQAERMILAAHKADIARALVTLEASYPGLAGLIWKVPPPQQATTVTADRIKKEVVQLAIDRLGVDPSEIPDGVMKESWDEILTIYSNASAYYGKDNIVSLVVDGKRQWYEVDPDLYTVLEGLDVYRLPRALDMIFGVPNRLFRLGATGLKASFGLVSNFLRDAMTFTVLSKHARYGPLSAAKGVIDDIRGTDAARQFKALGGSMSGQFGQDRTSAQHLRGEMLASSVKGKTIYHATHPIQAMRALFGVTEAGTRIGEFEAALKYGEERYGKGSRAAVIYAFNQAQDVTTNFTRHGRLAKIINQMVPFFNASLQGPDKILRTFRERPGATALKATAALTLPAILLWWDSKDEDWYKNLDPYERANYLHFRIPGTETIVRLPVPFELGHLFQSIPVAALDSMYRDDPKLVTEALEQAIERNNPIDWPAAVGPLIDVLRNKQFGDRPIVPMGAQRKLPKDQYGPYTTQLMKAIGRTINVSPAQLEYLVNQYSGGLYSRTSRSLQALTGGSDRQRVASDFPVIGVLFLRDPYAPRAQTERFYERRDLLEKKRGSGEITGAEDAERLSLNRTARALTPLWKQLREAKTEDDRKRLYERVKRLIERGAPAPSRRPSRPSRGGR